jgi:hypothetical protein
MLCDLYFGDSEKEIQIISMNGGNFGCGADTTSIQEESAREYRA